MQQTYLSKYVFRDFSFILIPRVMIAIFNVLMSSR